MTNSRKKRHFLTHKSKMSLFAVYITDTLRLQIIDSLQIIVLAVAATVAVGSAVNLQRVYRGRGLLHDRVHFLCQFL